MEIYKFQNGTKDYAIGVTYSTHGEELRLQSDEAPESELYLHASSVAYLALELFKIDGVKASFKEIVFSSGQTGRTTRLTLSVPVFNDDDAKLVLPAVSRRDREDAKTHEVDPTEPRNAYNLAVNLLEASIANYVQGRRLQMTLDFNAEAVREGAAQA